METPEKLLSLIDETITKASRLHPKASADGKGIVNNLLDMRNLIVDEHEKAKPKVENAPEKKLTAFNVNDKVTVHLTEAGIRYVKANITGWQSHLEHDGSWTDQMWRVMQDFGPRIVFGDPENDQIVFGGEQLFNSNITLQTLQTK